MRTTLIISILLGGWWTIGVVPCSAANFPATRPAATRPAIPDARNVVRYERLAPIFRSATISKEQGDALLAAMDGGRALELFSKQQQSANGAAPIPCALPIPPHLCLELTYSDGTSFSIQFSWNGEIVYLPDNIYVMSDGATAKAKPILAELDTALEKEVKSVPLPCQYEVGTIDDGGTLSGIARLFYGKPSKWKKIYEANRASIKDPNDIRDGMTLTIPK